jgi:hypothetical protein
MIIDRGASQILAFVPDSAPSQEFLSGTLFG